MIMMEEERRIGGGGSERIGIVGAIATIEHHTTMAAMIATIVMVLVVRLRLWDATGKEVHMSYILLQYYMVVRS